MLALETGISSLRRSRKAVLSELSALVKLAKAIDSSFRGEVTDAVESDILERMLSTAFRMVLRASKFQNIWAEQAAELEQSQLSLSSIVTGQILADVPPTPPADTAYFARQELERDVQRQAMDSAPPSASLSFDSQTSISSIDTSGSMMAQKDVVGKRPQSMTPCQPVTHRVSWTSKPSSVRNSKLASERLVNTHENFLSLLEVFIGCHLRSRSANEVLVATHRILHAGRALMTVVDAVWDRGQRSVSRLNEIRDNMYGKIADFVDAAKAIFQPAGHAEGDEYHLDDMYRVADAATSCVRIAGKCVASTRYALELIGDFEFETLDSSFANLSPKVAQTEDRSTEKAETPIANESSVLAKPPLSPSRLDRELPPPPPRINTGISSPEPTAPHEELTPSSSVVSSGLLPPLSSVGTPASFKTEHSPMSLMAPSTCDEPAQASVTKSGSKSSSTNTEESVKKSQDFAEANTLSDVTTGHSSVDGPTSNLETVPSTAISLKDDLALDRVVEDGEATILEQTHANELVFGNDGIVVGGTLPALVECLTTHNSTPDAAFVSTFFLTFRLFASPIEFAQALIDRFESADETPNAIRLRVYNVFKGWLESHWRMECDSSALETISNFAKNKLRNGLPSAGTRLEQLTDQVRKTSAPLVPRLVSSIGKTNTSTSQYVAAERPAPAPVVSKAQSNLLRSWKTGGAAPLITDFEPLEVARQLTIKESTIFCSILPEELVGNEWTKQSGSLAVNVRAMSTLSTDLTNLVTDTILQHHDLRQRARTIKQWIKISAKCLDLKNYDALMAIMCSLDNTTIQRLRRTWDAVSAKTKALLEQLRATIDFSKNHSTLRGRLADAIPPCLPFVGIFLTDLTFVDAGNPLKRRLSGSRPNRPKSVINFDRHAKTARIISELQRFQVPYQLQEVPELQAWIQDQLVRVRADDAGKGAASAQYRRSLLLEPRITTSARNIASAIPVPIPEGQALKTSKERVDFLGMMFNKSSAN